MAGKGDGRGEGTAKLDGQIACIKYTLFCFNIMSWIFGATLFAVTIWIRAEPGFDEWVQMLDIQSFYIGIYILIGMGVVVMVTSFLGCCSALMENPVTLLIFVGTQVFSFVIGVVGTALLLNYSTTDSSIQPILKHSITRLIMTSNYIPSRKALEFIQENIGCCGADGPNDFILHRHPLPQECRDTVTGNAHIFGCVEELTWILEDKAGWVAGIAMTLALIHVINAVLSTIMVQALKEEDKEARTYRN